MADSLGGYVRLDWRGKRLCFSELVGVYSRARKGGPLFE